jgi:hypothetical protein
MKNFNKRGQLISTLTMTFYKASAAVDVRWPLSPRTRPAGLLQHRLSEERN